MFSVDLYICLQPVLLGSLANNAADMYFRLPAAALHSGGFDCEEDAARAHDVMAMKCRGTKSTTNYDHKDYEHLLPRLENISKVAAFSFLTALSYAWCIHQHRPLEFLANPSTASSYTMP